jgi:hypothetical protein
VTGLTFCATCSHEKGEHKRACRHELCKCTRFVEGVGVVHQLPRPHRTINLVERNDDDACDVCLTARYPGEIPEDGDTPLARGWTTVIHPFDSMEPPEDLAVSLCCPACTRIVQVALGFQ